MAFEYAYLRGLLSVFSEECYKSMFFYLEDENEVDPKLAMQKVLKWQIISGCGKSICKTVKFFLTEEGEVLVSPDFLERAAMYVQFPDDSIFSQPYQMAAIAHSKHLRPKADIAAEKQAIDAVWEDKDIDIDSDDAFEQSMYDSMMTSIAEP